MSVLVINGNPQTPPLCACGCGEPIVGRRKGAKYATKACNTRAYNARHGIVGYRAVKRSQNRKAGRSSIRVSYLKAVEAVTGQLVELFEPADGGDFYRGLVEEGMRAALSPAQRRQLEDREAA